MSEQTNKQMITEEELIRHITTNIRNLTTDDFKQIPTEDELISHITNIRNLTINDFNKERKKERLVN